MGTEAPPVITRQEPVLGCPRAACRRSVTIEAEVPLHVGASARAPAEEPLFWGEKGIRRGEAEWRKGHMQMANRQE